MASIRFKFRASIAKSQDVPLADISEAMGHSTQRTTYI